MEITRKNVKVSLARLLRIGPNVPYEFCGGCLDKLTYNKLKDYYDEQEYYFKDHEDYRNREYDVGRVKYFINHPEKIDALDVTSWRAGYVTLDNGYHRLLAAQIKGLKYIHIDYNGPKENLDYLTGRICTVDQLEKIGKKERPKSVIW